MSVLTIDKNSGFCFGVVRAIREAEKQLEGNGGTQAPTLYCLGEIVHNNGEVARLENLGLRVIGNEDFASLHDAKVLIRAHGEPPSTYAKAKANNITLIDATCPIVLKLQERIKKGYEEMRSVGGQVLIYGKAGHAEVIGLNGQTGNHAIVVGSLEDLAQIDFSKPTQLYSQTTMNADRYKEIGDECAQQCALHGAPFTAVDSICKSMSLRAAQLKEFALQHEAIVFVSGKQSSNGKYLYDICRTHNTHTFFISAPEELKEEDFRGNRFATVGICGATSTPMWLMEKAAATIEKFCRNGGHATE